MISSSVSGAVFTRAANFLIRLLGAIRASLFVESQVLSLPNPCHVAPVLQISTDSEQSGFCEAGRTSCLQQGLLSSRPALGPEGRCASGLRIGEVILVPASELRLSL